MKRINLSDALRAAKPTQAVVPYRAKTSTERNRERLERLNQPGHEKALQDFKSKKKAYRSKVLEENDLNERRVKWKESKRRQRARRAAALRELCVTSDSEESSDEAEEKSAFPSKSAFYKATRKVQLTLPRNREKAREVIRALCKRFGVLIVDDIEDESEADGSDIEPAIPRKPGYERVDELAKQFFNLDIITMCLPGKRDFKIIRHKGGKEYRQKRMMLMSLKEALAEFHLMFPEQKMELTLLASLRPPHVELFHDIKHISCCCTICANNHERFEGLKPVANQPLVLKKLVESSVCDVTNYDCMSSACVDCPDAHAKIHEFLKPCCADEVVSYKQWVNNKGFLRRVQIEGEAVGDIVQKIEEDLVEYKLHTYLIKVQHDFLQNVKATQPHDQAVMQMDYAQNAECIIQMEAQASYFKRPQVAIFTCCIYSGQESQVSYVLATDELTHDAFQVFTFMGIILKHFKANYCPDLRKVLTGTDGCGPQFKNFKYFTSIMNCQDDFGVELECHFSERYHSKSSPDGLGGTMKRNVHQRVMTGKHLVYNAHDWVKVANTFSGERSHVFEVTKDELEVNRTMLEARWAKAQTVKDTRKFHSFQKHDDKHLKCAVSSIGDGSCIRKLMK